MGKLTFETSRAFHSKAVFLVKITFELKKHQKDFNLKYSCILYYIIYRIWMKRKNIRMFLCHRISYGYIDNSSEKSEQIQTTTENVEKEGNPSHIEEGLEINGRNFYSSL